MKDSISDPPCANCLMLGQCLIRFSNTYLEVANKKPSSIRHSSVALIHSAVQLEEFCEFLENYLYKGQSIVNNERYKVFIDLFRGRIGKTLEEKTKNRRSA